MPNIATVLKDEICRLARKEIRQATAATAKASAQHRRDIAALKRQVHGLEREIGFLRRQEKKRLGQRPAEAKLRGRGARFSAKGLISHRERLGISAENYGKLVGVTGLTIYNWESDKGRPRDANLAALVEVRGLGKREALKRLEMLGE